MAGAGYRTFTAGQILTAAQVQDYLQDQSVMVFNSSAARSSALGTAVAEGMVSYLRDTDSLELYSGSSWVIVNDNSASIPRSVIQAQGDLIVGATASSAVRLARGTANSLLQTSGTSVAWLAPGGVGQALTVGTAGLSWTSLGGATIALYTASGTFTVPTGVTAIDIHMVGGGGGGASGNSISGFNGDSQGFAGGGGGAYAYFDKIPVSEGQVWTITVGAGGAGGTVAAQTTAGTTLRTAGGTGTSTSISLSGRVTLSVNPGNGAGTTQGAFGDGGAAIASTSPQPTNQITGGTGSDGSGNNNGVDVTLNIAGSGNNNGRIGKVLFGLGSNGASPSANAMNPTSQGGTAIGGICGGGGGAAGASSTTQRFGGDSGPGGGGGGAAAWSTATGSGITITGGNGGDGAANSGGGGGGGGSSRTASGNTAQGGRGGNGGSGFVAIFY